MIIFGQNIPLVEALFISLMIIICILITNVVYMILMMSDLKKLKATLVTERANLYKLENDINSFEQGKYKTKQQKQTAIGNYIHSAFQKGYDRHEIETALKDKGWPKEIVEAVLDNAVNHLKRFYKDPKTRDTKKRSIRGYIHSAFKNGFDKNEIKDALVKNGWSKDDVEGELGSAVDHLKKIYKKDKR